MNDEQKTVHRGMMDAQRKMCFLLFIVHLSSFIVSSKCTMLDAVQLQGED